MGKHKIAHAVSAAALIAGSGLFAPAVFADEGNPFCIEGGECYGTLQDAFDQVPSDGTLTTIYLDSNQDVVEDGGGAFYTSGKTTKDGVKHPANGNYNVVFDLKGKTYVISKAPVGSTGYETQAFHLERGGNFVFKDGTIKAASGSGVWFILQNYANTTLENVTLDGSDNTGITYVASNNFGSLNVKGNSQILAADSKVAFDLWYGMSAVYDDGITVTFGDDFTGKVVGAIEYGHHSRISEDSDWRSKTKLIIEGGEFDVTFKDGSAGALVDANIQISGGKFASEPEESEIVEGMEAEEEDGFWTIYPKEIDYGNKWIESDSDAEGQMSAAVEFGEELIADRKATLSVVEKDTDGLALDAAKGGELISAIDIDMLNRDRERIEVKDNSLVVYLDLDEATHAKLSAYDELYAVYFENGAEKDRFEVTLSDPDDGYWLSFETSHLSTYGIVGVNSAENEEADAATDAAAAPETGTMTAAGASATGAAMVTAVAVGILTSVVSFVYLMRRR